MTAVSPHTNPSRDTWTAAFVFGLDRWLRRREAVFEYTDNPGCVFRIQRSFAEAEAILNDGTEVRHGDPVVALHIWNEQVPIMAPSGPSVGWAREVSRKVVASLRELEEYLAARREFDSVKVISADIALGTAESGEQILRMAARYGFEGVAEEETESRMLRKLGENTLMLMLVLATNPASARLSVLRRQRRPVYVSRATLARHLPQASAPRVGKARS
ncbi:MAG TPA: hypothetical protein VFJ18_01755 [Pararhizobium sp.]|nr:hypothetical protein [Pararhizobium sp.]